MSKDSTEMDDMDISINQRHADRTSWNSFTSEDSNAQTTLYSPTQFNHTINNDPKNQLLQDNTYYNSRAPSLTSRKHTLLPLSSDQANEEEVLEELPTSSTSNSPPQPPPVPPINTPTATKSNILSRFMASLPMFAQMRKTIKAAVALLIGTIFIFESKTRAASGSSMLLVPIVVIFYFPVRTIGINDYESTIFIYMS